MTKAAWESKSGWSALLLLGALAAGCGAELGSPIEVQPFQIKGGDGSPAWSPDGTHIAYIHAPASGTSSVWVVDSAGQSPHAMLTSSWGFLDWSHDGAHLALSNYSGIYSIRSNGDSLRLITATGFDPRWAPSGAELAFQTRDTSGVGTIWRISSDGSGLRALVPPPNESWDEPAWSPDGSRLVHVRRLMSTGSMDVFVMDTTGRAEQKLTTQPGDHYGPVWSPDGKWIAWSIGTFEPANELWIMRSDGTGARKLGYGGAPSWSPDSRRIAYELLQYDTVQLFAIDIETLRSTQLTH